MRIVYSGVSVSSGSEGLQEYCQSETFSPSCPPGEVIYMEEARYGRMSVGRYLKRDYYVGYVDKTILIIFILQKELNLKNDYHNAYHLCVMYNK